MPKMFLAGFAALLLSASTPAVVIAGSSGTPAAAPAPAERAPARAADAEDDDDLPTLEEYAQYGGPADPPAASERSTMGVQPGHRRQATEAQFDEPARRFRPSQRMMALCSPDGARIVERMVERMERITRPAEAQRPALDKLKQAAAKAHEAGKAACPTERYASLPLRFAEIEKRLAARLESIRIIRPALEEYYATLTDEQKARLNLLSMAPARSMRSGEDNERRSNREERGSGGGERDDWPRGWRGRL